MNIVKQSCCVPCILSCVPLICPLRLLFAHVGRRVKICRQGPEYSHSVMKLADHVAYSCVVMDVIRAAASALANGDATPLRSRRRLEPGLVNACGPGVGQFASGVSAEDRYLQSLR